MNASQELLETERDYVRDLRTLCDIKADCAKLLSPAEVSAVFSNCDALLGINSELLQALEGASGDAPDDAHVRTYQAFQTLAPYLRAYAGFCTQALTAQERVKALRGASAALDQAMSAAEQAMGQPVGSWLIKPVQRLCKYPLLLESVLREVPAAGAAREGLERAATAIQQVVNEVNERVRAAEEREGLLVLAEALGLTHSLVTPQRALLLSVAVTKWIETHSSGVIGIEAEIERLQRLDADRAAVRPQHRAAIWLCSDLLLLGRPKGASYAVLEQTAVQLSTIELLELTAAAGTSVVRLACETGAVYLLEMAPDDAHLLADGLAAAREKAAESQRVRARGALGELEARKVGGEQRIAERRSVGELEPSEKMYERSKLAALKTLKERRATRHAADPLTLSFSVRRPLDAEHSALARSGGGGGGGARRETTPERAYGSWTLRLRLHMSAAARELSAGSFGRRSHKRPGGGSSSADEPQAGSPPLAGRVRGGSDGGGLAPDAKSRRRSEPDAMQTGRRSGGAAAVPPASTRISAAQSASSEEDVAALLHCASTVGLPPPPPPPPPHGGSTQRQGAAATHDARNGSIHVLGVELMHIDAGSERTDAPPATPTGRFQALPPRRPVLRDLIRTAESSGDAFHDELLLALRRRAAL